MQGHAYIIIYTYTLYVIIYAQYDIYIYIYTYIFIHICMHMHAFTYRYVRLYMYICNAETGINIMFLCYELWVGCYSCYIWSVYILVCSFFDWSCSIIFSFIPLSVIVLMILSGLFVCLLFVCLFVCFFFCLFALYMQLYLIAEAHEQGVCGHFFGWLSPSASLSNISMSP